MCVPRKPLATLIAAFSITSGGGQKDDTATKRPDGFDPVISGQSVTVSGASLPPKKTEGGDTYVMDLLYMSAVKIVRHIKIRGMANPYDRRWQEYFSRRSIRTYHPAIDPEPCC
jgi:hypothetical protein